MKKQKILFVINTLGRAGAESALLSLLSVLDPSQYDISLYVIMAQGEMRAELPIYVKLCNPHTLFFGIFSETAIWFPKADICLVRHFPCAAVKKYQPINCCGESCRMEAIGLSKPLI